MNDNDKKLLNLQWFTMPPTPVPGLFKMQMEINVDTTTHCDAIDKDYRNVYEDPMDILNIDVIDELIEFNKKDEKQWLKKDQSIDKGYYARQNERSEVFTRYAQSELLEKIFDYKEALKESFEKVNEQDSDVVESYPLFPSNEDNFVMIAGADFDFNSYTNNESDSVVNKIQINNKKYRLTLQNVDEYICINIKEGKAFYSFMKYIHKLSK
ncbi:hypothetical protein NUSPORA_02290 [Nucleospora cyclopteri]